MIFLNTIKKRRIKKKILQEVQKSSAEQSTLSKNKINSILVFTDKKTPNNFLKTIEKSLNIKKEKVTILEYLDVVPKENTSEDYLSQQDFSILGNVKRPYIKNLITSKFDLLINLTKENLFLDAFASKSKAAFKVGFYNEEIQIYNFMIDTDINDIPTFMSESKKYLQILNKL